MADRTFASLVPRVQASVPGCPHATTVQYIRDSAIRTCERTLYWRYQVPLFNLLPGVSEYAYNKPTNTDLDYSYRCRLRKGTYTYRVYATDLAGNTQARPSVKKLWVR